MSELWLGNAGIGRRPAHFQVGITVRKAAKDYRTVIRLNRDSSAQGFVAAIDRAIVMAGLFAGRKIRSAGEMVRPAVRSWVERRANGSPGPYIRKARNGQLPKVRDGSGRAGHRFSGQLSDPAIGSALPRRPQPARGAAPGVTSVR